MSEVGAVLLVGFVAAAIAFWGVLSQRAIARRRATIEILARRESDSDSIEARKKFIELAKSRPYIWLTKQMGNDTNAADKPALEPNKRLVSLLADLIQDQFGEDRVEVPRQWAEHLSKRWLNKLAQGESLSIERGTH